MDFKTADLCDEFEQSVAVAEPLLRDYGGTASFRGSLVTVKVFEDNVLVREALETDGRGRVLAVDGGGSTRCTLVGDRLAQLAYENGWTGIIVNGCIRDSEEIPAIPAGVKALHTVPKKSAKNGVGERDAPVRFAGLTFTPGHYLYADLDGMSSRTGTFWPSVPGSPCQRCFAGWGTILMADGQKTGGYVERWRL